jgi:diguanylate cyclase (GGDEF)-like protein
MPDSGDSLTGLHARPRFMALLHGRIDEAVERREMLGLLVVDIDGFARINGVHGYEFGDQLLRHLGRQLTAVGRAQDCAARIGGDRFALLLPRLLNAGHAELAVQKLYRLLDVPFEADGKRVRIAASIGVALCPTNGNDAGHLLRAAEKALDVARQTGRRSLFAQSAGGHSDGAALPWDIGIELDNALDRGEITMHYQPQLSASGLRPVGVEALMRWNSPRHGRIPPDVFIPVAEQTGQIRALTVWALNTALRQASDWKHAWGELSLAVNVPPELVAQPDLPDLVQNAIRLWGSDRIQLVLEITERSLMDSRNAFAILSRIRDMGVRVSIDDFGTGYSCLEYFKNLPVDELKVDRSFVAGLLIDPASTHISTLIIELAHRFGMTVVAEGVEDEATLRTLRRNGCDRVQGYLFKRPVPADELERWLHEACAGPGVELMALCPAIDGE